MAPRPPLKDPLAKAIAALKRSKVKAGSVPPPPGAELRDLLAQSNSPVDDLLIEMGHPPGVTPPPVGGNLFAKPAQVTPGGPPAPGPTASLTRPVNPLKGAFQGLSEPSVSPPRPSPGFGDWSPMVPDESAVHTTSGQPTDLPLNRPALTDGPPMELPGRVPSRTIETLAEEPTGITNVNVEHPQARSTNPPPAPRPSSPLGGAGEMVIPSPLVNPPQGFEADGAISAGSPLRDEVSALAGKPSPPLEAPVAPWARGGPSIRPQGSLPLQAQEALPLSAPGGPPQQSMGFPRAGAPAPKPNLPPTVGGSQQSLALAARSAAPAALENSLAARVLSRGARGLTGMVPGAALAASLYGLRKAGESIGGLPGEVLQGTATGIGDFSQYGTLAPGAYIGREIVNKGMEMAAPLRGILSPTANAGVQAEPLTEGLEIGAVKKKERLPVQETSFTDPKTGMLQPLGEEPAPPPVDPVVHSTSPAGPPPANALGASLAEALSAAVPKSLKEMAGQGQQLYTGMEEKGIVGSAPSGDIDLDQLMAAFRRQESSGNPLARNPRTDASGLYQVMPSNIGPWAQEAGLGEVTQDDFLNSPELQEKIARFKLNQYLNEAKGKASDSDEQIRRVASAWYSGNPDRFENPMGVGPGGKEPSIRDYTLGILSKYRGAPKSGRLSSALAHAFDPMKRVASTKTSPTGTVERSLKKDPPLSAYDPPLEVPQEILDSYEEEKSREDPMGHYTYTTSR